MFACCPEDWLLCCSNVTPSKLYHPSPYSIGPCVSLCGYFSYTPSYVGEDPFLISSLLPFLSCAGFKETAFMYAVSSAALTHSLARACSAGRMERCTCDDSPDLENRKAWQWGVCGDNLKYSTKFLKNFLGQKKIGKDLRAKVDIHNTNVGIKVRGRAACPERGQGSDANILTYPLQSCLLQENWWGGGRGHCPLLNAYCPLLNAY